MAWNILTYINIDNNNNKFKFWSYSESNIVAWGRIGTNGTHREFPESNIRTKVQQKLNEGYRVFAERVDYHSPNPQEVRDFWDGDRGMIQGVEGLGHPAEERQSVNREQIIGRSRREVDNSAPAPAPRTRKRTNYKTDTKGFIPKYREGYTREKLDFKVWKKSNLEGDLINIKLCSQFYKSIPQNMLVYPKRKFGFEFNSQELFSRNSGNVRFISLNNKIVGIYEMVKNTGVCEMFYIKTASENRTSLVKFMVISMITLARQGNREMVIKSKGLILKSILKDMFEWDGHTMSQGIDYWKINSNVITQLNVQNIEQSEFKRFQEMDW